MSAINSVLANWQKNITGTIFGDDAVKGGDFSSLFNSRLSKLQGNYDAMLSKLAERFPTMSFAPGKVGEGVQAAKEHYETSAEDQVTVAPEVLEGMAKNSQYARQIEMSIATITGNLTNLMMVDGTNVQRNVTITVATIRYTELYRSNGDDSVLAAADLTTDFQERLQEMLKKFFGETTGTTDAEGSESTASSTSNALMQGGGFMAAWRLEIYYSNAMFSTSADSVDDTEKNQKASQNGGNSLYSGLSAFFGMQYGKSATNGTSFPITGYNGMHLANFMSASYFSAGFQAENVRMGCDGLFFALRDSRTMLADLLDRLNSGTPALPESEPVGGENETVEENAVQAV